MHENSHKIPRIDLFYLFKTEALSQVILALLGMAYIFWYLIVFF